MQENYEEKEFSERLQKFIEKIDGKYMEYEKNGIPEEIYEYAGRIGLMGMLIPEKYGGGNHSSETYAKAIIEISKRLPSLGVILSVHNSVGAHLIYDAGNELQMEKFLPELCTGKKIAGFAITEASAGSDVMGIKTTAKKKRDVYVLNGSKIFITNYTGDVFNILAYTDIEKGKKGQSLFIVEKDMKGFSIGSREKKMGLHSSYTGELILEDVEVPLENMLGKEGDGMKLALRALNCGRIGIAAQSIGIADAILHMTINILGKNMPQNKSFAVAEMASELKSAELLLMKACKMRDSGRDFAVYSSMAKYYASEISNITAERCISLLGMSGVSNVELCHRFNDTKVLEIYEGTNEIQKIIIFRMKMSI